MANWGEGAKGATGGALAGGALGGPPGAIIGGIAGGAMGLFGGDNGQADYQKRLEEYYASMANRQAPQAGPAAQGQYSGFRDNQSQMISRLDAMSRGQGPSLAKQQFAQATDRNIGAQQAMGATGRGGAMGAFNAANNMGMLGTQAAQGSALARTNEQTQAYQQLGMSLYGARNADEDMNKFNAGQQNQTALANLDARLKAMGMDDAARLALLQQMGGQANQPTMGDQIMAGGAGMFAQGATMGQKPAWQQNMGNGNWANGQSSGYQKPKPGVGFFG